MAKHRFFIKSTLSQGEVVILEGQEASHIRNVLRLKKGDEVTLFNGAGKEAIACIDDSSRAMVKLSILESKTESKESLLDMHLAQGISKGERMDFVIQKAVELGVSCFTPVITQFMALKLDEKRMAKKMQHWQKIIENASAQSQRNRLMQLNQPCHLADILKQEAVGPKIMLEPNILGRINDLPQDLKQLMVVIGPEGGFSKEETLLAKSQKVHLVSLGPRVLRTETAALAACAILQMKYGDFAL